MQSIVSNTVLANLLTVSLIVVLANAPFWVLSSQFSQHMFLVSIEISLVALIATSRYSLVAGLVACWILGSTSIVSNAFNVRLGDLALYWFELTSIGISDFTPFVFIGSMFFFSCCFTLYILNTPFFRRIGGDSAFRLKLTSIIFLLFVDSVNGSSALSFREGRLWRGNIVSSPTVQFIREIGRAEPIVKLAPSSSAVEHSAVISWAAANPDRNIWYIIVESWGGAAADKLNQRLMNTLTRDLLSAYDISSRKMTVTGSTTDAELRELCNVSGEYRSLLYKDNLSCLPSILRNMGFTTSGFHGNNGRFFSRELWWPAIGLEKLYFLEDFSPNVVNRCGTVFVGLCDRPLMELAFSIGDGGGNFIYFLTLNSHYPVTRPADQAVIIELCDELNISVETCAIFNEIDLSFQVLNQLMVDSKLKQDLVVVVGDHPPFQRSITRERKEQYVQAVTFFPKK